MADDVRAEFRRYGELVAPMIGAAGTLAPEVETTGAVQVERGVIYPAAMTDATAPDTSAIQRLIELADPQRLESLIVVDRARHARPAYRGILVYGWLQAFRILYETLPRSEFGRWEEGLRPWCDDLEARLTTISWPAAGGAIAAAHGATATEAAWTALALHVAGKVFIRDAWTDLAADAFGKLTRSQQQAKPTSPGPWLGATPSDNPETTWYHELVLLHAAASYAVQAEDRAVAAAVARNAMYHLQETQPDHATSDPWGLFAFIWVAPARSLADQLLHAASIQQAAPRRGLSLILLADALYCLRLFLK